MTYITCGDRRRKRRFAEVEREVKPSVGGGARMKESSLWSECYGQTPLVYTEMAARSRSREGGGGAGRGREQIQTRWGLEEGMDGGMEGGMRGQVCVRGPYKAWITGKMWKGSRDTLQGEPT